MLTGIFMLSWRKEVARFLPSECKPEYSASMTPTAIIIAALALATIPAAAQCTSQPAVGGGRITSCRTSDGERTQYSTREAVGGGTITIRATSTRPSAGSVPDTTCGPAFQQRSDEWPAVRQASVACRQ